MLNKDQLENCSQTSNARYSEVKFSRNHHSCHQFLLSLAPRVVVPLTSGLEERLWSNPNMVIFDWVFEWSKNTYRARCRRWIFFTIGTWIGFFFLSLLAKNHQILHIHWCNTRQEQKLRIPPEFMYRFSCSFVSWNSGSQVGAKHKPSISISSCHSNNNWVLKESSVCSLSL